MRVFDRLREANLRGWFLLVLVMFLVFILALIFLGIGWSAVINPTAVPGFGSTVSQRIAVGAVVFSTGFCILVVGEIVIVKGLLDYPRKWSKSQMR